MFYLISANFLEGDFGQAVLKEYNGKAEKDYSNTSALNVLSYNRDIVRGSNPFVVVLINQIVEQEGLRTATQADLERILKVNALPLQGQYEDTGLVLRSADTPNKYLAKNLMQQIKAKNPKAKMPVMIPLNGLELVADSSSPYKLAFKLKDSTEAFYDLSVLNKNGNFSSKDIDEETGLPKKTGNSGDRYLYTTNSGLSGFYLGGDLSLDSNYDSLAYSYDYGRVVVVSAEGTSQNLKKYFAELEQEKANQIAKITSKFNQAMSILKQ
jgi:hypothetical protein